MLEKAREIHKQVFEHRSDGDMYNILEIKAFENILRELKGIIMRKYFL